MALTVETLTSWMNNFEKKINQNKKYLSELDTHIGDGDHGYNLDRGMTAVIKKLDTSSPADVSAAFKDIAMALISSVGGASGPLYGTAFLEMSKKSTETLNLGELIQAGLEGIERRGGATPGDKTMVDVWSEVIEDIKNNTLTETNIQQTVDATKPLTAKKGRASYLGERSIGHVDPGSQSSGYLFDAMLETEGLL